MGSEILHRSHPKLLIPPIVNGVYTINAVIFLDFFLHRAPAFTILRSMKTVRSSGAGSGTYFFSLRRALSLLVLVCSLFCLSLAALAQPALAQANSAAATTSVKKVSAPAAKKAAPAKKKKAKTAASRKKTKPYIRSLASPEDRVALRERGISSGFGKRAVSRKNTRMHKGIDVPGPKDSKVVAFNDGEVIFTGVKSGYGKTVIVRQIDGREALYAHMNKYVVSKGDAIRRGDQIGHVGRTGRATGYHLHFEMVDDGQNLDPALHVWHGSELVLSPGDLDLDAADTTRVAEPTRRQSATIY